MTEFNEPLTERELEVVSLVATGMTNKEVAAKLFLSPSTVKVHLSNIFTKLNVHTRTELTMLVIRSGWVEGTPAAKMPPTDPIEPAPEPQALPKTDAPNPHEVSQPLPREPIAETPFIEQVLPQPRPAPVPLRVAPNPSALPKTPLWRRLALALAAVSVATGTLLPASEGGSANPGPDGTSLVTSAGSDSLIPGESTRWTQRTALPQARARATAATLNNKVYIIGGETNQIASGDVQIFNNRANSWENGPPKPTPVWNAASSTLGNAIYVTGGNTANGAPSNRNEYLDATSNEWHTAAPMPKALAGHAMTESEGRLYVFGGRSVDGVNATSYMYDRATNSWSTRTALPTPRSLASAIAARGRIYVLGGFDDGRESAACEVFTPPTNTWADCPPMLLPRGSFGLLRAGNTLYAIGGGRAGFIGFNERFDLNANRWSTFETPITGDWHSAAVAADGSELYVFGGYSSGRRLASAYLFEAQQNQIFLPAISSQGDQK